MKLTKCINGHFYDAEKFSTCPHCAGNATGEVSDDSVTVGYSSDMDAGVTAPLNQNDFPPVQPQVRMVKPPIGGMNPGNLNMECSLILFRATQKKNSIRQLRSLPGG